MPYLYCGRCGLEIKAQAEFRRREICPRCLARSATVPQVIAVDKPCRADRDAPSGRWSS
jgi:hypothetical protein